MSKDLFESMQELMDNLRDYFETSYEEDKSFINPQHQKLSNALNNQIELQLKYDEMLRTALYIVNTFETESERLFAIAFQELMSDSYKKLTTTEARQYAGSDSDYVDVRRQLNESKYLKGQIESVVEALKTRRFLLKNITDMLHDGNEDYII